MPAVLADLCIDARWIVPMTARGQVLERHTLAVRDGRIIGLVPSAEALQRYAATVVIHRPAHLLMPGLINAHTHAALSLFRERRPPDSVPGPPPIGAEFVNDGVAAALAEMLASGITCFADRAYYPDETARTAAAQGLRAVIGLPVAETAGPRARSATEYFTQGLRVRDDYAGHPLISTVFAPRAAPELSDAALTKLVTLADELDAGILIDLHESAEEIARSVAAHGVRPIERLWQLGMLTPALTGVYMTHATAADVELAARTGISVGLGPSSSLGRERQLPPLLSFVAAGIRAGLGTGGAPCANQDLWSELKLIALAARGEPGYTAWDALAIATRGGAAILGLDAHVGTLEPGKWADLCCIDLSGAATQPLLDPVTQLVFCGGRDAVTDVWVAGRQLLSDREYTRLDWTRVAARCASWAERMKMGDQRGA